MTLIASTPEAQERLDAEIEQIPAYQLPSVKTQDSLLNEALASDEPEFIKSVLLHTWLHYQALEFALASYDFNKTAFEEGVEEHGLTDLLATDPAAVASQVIGTNLILSSYQAAHMAQFVGALTGEDDLALALRTMYEGLDFEAPAEDTADIIDTDGAGDTEGEAN